VYIQIPSTECFEGKKSQMVLSRSAEYGVLIWRNLRGFLKRGEMQYRDSASPHGACRIVIAEKLSRARFMQPLLVYSIDKKLDFENSDIDGTPTRPVEPLAEIATATDTAMMQDRSSVLFDCSRIVATYPDVCGRSLRVFQIVPLSQEATFVRSPMCSVSGKFVKRTGYAQLLTTTENNSRYQRKRRRGPAAQATRPHSTDR
jgi:hypothetical protein